MVSVGSVLAGTVLLYFGAHWLIRGASSLAASMGVAPAVVGLTVVAFGTSLPELVVSVTAALGGNGDIALGNVVGSNIANVGLILGAAATLRALSVESTLVRREVPMGLAAVVLVVTLAADGVLGRLDGLVLLVGFGGFLYWSAVVERVVPDAAPREPVAGTARRGRDAAVAAAGLVGVFLGGRWLVSGGVAIAEALGVPGAVIGLSVVAVGTSLPELAASLAAVSRREDDIGVGNVVGSNLFNLLGVLGVTVLVDPIVVPAGFFRFQFPVLAGFTVALLPVFGTGGRVSRGEGMLLLAAYAGYIAALYLVPGLG